MEIVSLAYTVLLPAIADLVITDELNAYFDLGGRSILLGETRKEYLDRRMSEARCAEETSEEISAFTVAVREKCGSPLVAVDQEPCGTCRLHNLVPQFPSREELQSMPDGAISEAALAVARAAHSMGVNMALAPVVDIIGGSNPWLKGRTLGSDSQDVARIAAAFVRGFQSGGMVSVPKHFPGHHDITADPAIAEAQVPAGLPALQPGFRPFESVIEAGALAMMIGPALVPALDPREPSSTSPATVQFLRKDFGFKGLIVSDDLDGKATLAGRTIEATAVQALGAGADLLLIAAGEQIHTIAAAIVSAVDCGTLDLSRLNEAASRVKQLAAWAKSPGS